MAVLLCGGLVLAPLLASRLNRSPAIEVLEVDNAAAVSWRSKSAGPRSAVLLRLVPKDFAGEASTGPATATTELHDERGDGVPAPTSPPTSSSLWGSGLSGSGLSGGASERALEPIAAEPAPLATTPSTSTPPTTNARPLASRTVGSRSDTGTASWYQTYDRTCAHKSLPKGTVVRVENLENGKVAFCRVADRGPYLDGRIIDLDVEVFQQLADSSQGVIEVRIRW